jgi:hypothetical protein
VDCVCLFVGLFDAFAIVWRWFSLLEVRVVSGMFVFKPISYRSVVESLC